ncbi:multiubiquitin domain-containing protein [Leifsonia sp. RAF41]|uniref:multiubiquitin domain-containing protein n=1 Tax=Leifsonia sp. RAF41 TaxID=3233056 RepID=UPI003F97E773
MAPQDTTEIYIDRESIEVHKRHLTGNELRKLVSPHAENLWLDVADAQDDAVAPTEQVAIEPGMRFFTDRPRTIYIDKAPYVVRTAVLTEIELRALPSPPVPADHGIWKDIVDDLDDPIKSGELVPIASGDRFFTRPLPQKDIHVTVNRRPVTLHSASQTGRSVKESAIAQGVPIKIDFLLSRKAGAKFQPVGDDESIRTHNEDEFRANDGDDNS